MSAYDAAIGNARRLALRRRFNWMAQAALDDSHHSVGRIPRPRARATRQGIALQFRVMLKGKRIICGQPMGRPSRTQGNQATADQRTNDGSDKTWPPPSPLA